MTETNARILIVDDERTTRLMLNKGLQKEGYEIEEAVDGEEALGKMKEFDPHVILLDVMMPGVTGDELIGTLKELQPRVEVIMVTAIEKEEILAECRRKGAFGVISKPVNFGDLRTRIKEALEHRRKQAAE